MRAPVANPPPNTHRRMLASRGVRRRDTLSDDSEFDPAAPAIDIDYYVNGGNCLSESENAILGDVAGMRILVSPEGTGEEVLSLLNLGADVTVLGSDFVQLQLAMDALGKSAATFLGGLGLSVPAELSGQQFDLIYSPWGSLDGLAAFDSWATDVAAFLPPGGHLVAFDEHPVSLMVRPAGSDLVVTTSYWGEFIDEDNDGEPDVPDIAAGPTTFGWALGDLVTALGDAGMATTRLQEFEESGRFLSALELLEEVDDETRSRLPSALLLVARRI